MKIAVARWLDVQLGKKICRGTQRKDVLFVIGDNQRSLCESMVSGNSFRNEKWYILAIKEPVQQRVLYV